MLYPLSYEGGKAMLRLILTHGARGVPWRGTGIVLRSKLCAPSSSSLGRTDLRGVTSIVITHCIDSRHRARR